MQKELAWFCMADASYLRRQSKIAKVERRAERSSSYAETKLSSATAKDSDNWKFASACLFMESMPEIKTDWNVIYSCHRIVLR